MLVQSPCICVSGFICFLKEMKFSITKLHFVLTYCITLCQFKKKTYVI